MAEIRLDWNAEDEGLLKSLDKIIEKSKQVDELNDSNQKRFKEAFGAAGKAASDASKDINKASNTLVENKRATDEASKSANVFTKRLEEQAKSISIFGVNLGDVIDNFKDFRKGLRDSIGGAKGFAGAMKIVKVAIASTGIGLLIVALGSLVAFFTKTQAGSEKLRVAFAGLGQVVNVLVDRAGKLGSAIISLFSGDRKKAAEQYKAAISGINEELREEIRLVQELEKQAIKNEKAQALFNASFAKARKEIEALKLASDDVTKSEQERLKAAQEAFAIETQLNQKGIELAREQAAQAAGLKADSKEFAEVLEIVSRNYGNIEIAAIAADEATKRLGPNESGIQDLEAFTEAVVKIYDTEQQSLTLRTELNNKINSITQEGITKLEEYRGRVSELQSTIQETLNTIFGQRGTPLEILNFQKEQADKELEQLRSIARELGKEADLTEAFDTIARENERAYQEGLNRIFADERVAAYKEQVRKLKIKADDIRLTDSEKEEIANEIANLESVIESELKVLPTTLKPVANEAGKLVGVQIAEGAASDEVRMSLGEALDKLKSGFQDAFQLSDEQLAFAGDQITSIYNNFTAAAQASTQAQIDANQRVIDSIRYRISEVQGALEEEQRLADEGLANNVAVKERELEELRKREQQRLKEQEKLRKEQIRQQQIADGISQASALITAAANITKGFSSFGPYSLILIPLALAALFSFFAKAKADARAAQSQPQTFRKGGKLEGPSHEGGGIPLLNKKGQVLGEAEGGEWILNKQVSNEHHKFLEKLNEGKYKGINLAAIANGAKYKPERPKMELLGGGNMPIINLDSGSDKVVKAIKEQSKYIPYGDYIEMKETGTETIKKVVRVNK